MTMKKKSNQIRTKGNEEHGEEGGEGEGKEEEKEEERERRRKAKILGKGGERRRTFSRASSESNST